MRDMARGGASRLWLPHPKQSWAGWGCPPRQTQTADAFQPQTPRQQQQRHALGWQHPGGRRGTGWTKEDRPAKALRSCLLEVPALACCLPLTQCPPLTRTPQTCTSASQFSATACAHVSPSCLASGRCHGMSGLLQPSSGMQPMLSEALP